MTVDRTIPPMKPGDTLIDGDLTMTVGTWRGITFIDRPTITVEPERPNPVDIVPSRDVTQGVSGTSGGTSGTVPPAESQQSSRK